MACKTQLGLDVLKRSSTLLNLTLSENKHKQAESNTDVKTNVKWSQIVDVLQRSHTFTTASSHDNQKRNRDAYNYPQNTATPTRTTVSTKSGLISRKHMSPWLLSKCTLQQPEQEKPFANIESKDGRELMLCVAETEIDRIRNNSGYLQTRGSKMSLIGAIGKQTPRNRCKETPVIHAPIEKHNIKEHSNITRKNADENRNWRENIYIMESPLITAMGTSIFPAVSCNKENKEEKSAKQTASTNVLQHNNARSFSNNSRTNQRLGLMCGKKILHPKGKCNRTRNDSPVSLDRERSSTGSKRKPLTVNVSFSFMDEVFEFDSHRPIYSASSDNQSTWS